MKFERLLKEVSAISRLAGDAILEVYDREGDIKVEYKEDASPLTEADLAAHVIIDRELGALTPEIPVLSEESGEISWSERQKWQSYWLVDPLDGTKEFINRNGEFTVNIALIKEGVPVLGVVYVPVLDVLYSGSNKTGAFKEVSGVKEKIVTAKLIKGQDTLKVVASRNHRGEQLDVWLENAGKYFSTVDFVSMGSSLKICLVAEGKADIYPRLALTSEWDTAAAQAVLEAAGGVLVDKEFQVYRYNQKENILNPFFFAIGDRHYQWENI